MTEMKKFIVTINWHREVRKFYTSSASEEGALFNACNQLAKKLRVTSRSVKTYVLQGDKYKVERR